MALDVAKIKETSDNNFLAKEKTRIGRQQASWSRSRQRRFYCEAARSGGGSGPGSGAARLSTLTADKPYVYFSLVEENDIPPSGKK